MRDDVVTPKKARRESQLEQLVFQLSDSVAVLLSYMASIDDVIDPFEDIDVDKAWLICSLTTNCRANLFEDARHMEPWGMETQDVINAARRQKCIDIRETPLYQQARAVVSRYVQHHGKTIALRSG